MESNTDFVVLISADAEWRVVKAMFSDHEMPVSPFGGWFIHTYIEDIKLKKPVVFMQGGWGKVAAAASAQYAIDRWHPRLLVNLGTCGGFEGDINRGDILLVEKTVIYDIYEQMGDPDEHIQHYSVNIDNSWLSVPLPLPVTRKVLVSGDRDLFWRDIPLLRSKYGAIAGDWESGSIAWIAHRNDTRCLILRGVSDLVGTSGGDAYEGKVSNYYENTQVIMKRLVDSLPKWLFIYENSYNK